MEDKRHEFIQWIKIHKKELCVAGISIASMVGIILGIKNRNQLLELWEKLQRITFNSLEGIGRNAHIEFESLDYIPVTDIVLTSKTTKPVIAVKSHVRTLPDGWKPSLEKRALAEKQGLILLGNQTIVDAYVKGSEAA